MKGIILAAGYGTRFLPATKTLPKEMLPLINKPAISFLIEEFIASGITDIIVITSRRKKALEDYFDREIELEANLNEDKKETILPKNINVCFIRQQKMQGTGHALLLAKPWIGDEPVIVAYPDDIHVGTIPLSLQLIQRYQETGKTVLSTLYNPPLINNYGVLKFSKQGDYVESIVEKPPLGQEPSLEASIGRFLYTPEFFHYLEEGYSYHKEGEYFHIYGLEKLMQQKKVTHHRLQGEYWDVGTPKGYLRAVLSYLKKDKELYEIFLSEKDRV